MSRAAPVVRHTSERSPGTALTYPYAAKQFPSSCESYYLTLRLGSLLHMQIKTDKHKLRDPGRSLGLSATGQFVSQRRRILEPTPNVSFTSQKKGARALRVVRDKVFQREKGSESNLENYR